MTAANWSKRAMLLPGQPPSRVSPREASRGDFPGCPDPYERWRRSPLKWPPSIARFDLPNANAMRIALTVDPELAVPPLHYGGIERIVDMLAAEFARRGHFVTLFANRLSTCPVTHVPWPGERSNRLSDTIRNAATLARHVLTNRFDVIHSFSRIAYLTPLLPVAIPKLMSYQREISPRTTSLAQRLSRDTIEFTAISRRMI